MKQSDIDAAAGYGDETGPLEMMDLRKKKSQAKGFGAKKKVAPPMQKKEKMRKIPIDESGSVELPEGEPYGLERPMKKGGKVKKYAKGGSVTRGDGACKKGHTKGKMV